VGIVLGYLSNDDPSLTELAAYVGYVVVVVGAALARRRQQPSATAGRQAEAVR
jgi:hypothetical protein